ncbi:MAG TPA: hypothetical protein DDX92_03745 [Flavobacteriales bacterium]|jgi:hypothetical protein|nr:hypothetical protein [Flavobacteriales bacterium]
MRVRLSVLLLLFSTSFVQAQYTRVFGEVRDSVTDEPLPFVNIVFKGKNVGCITDVDGKFDINTQWGSNTISISSVGYERKDLPVNVGEKQKLIIHLAPNVQQLETVEIKADKKRYKNKDNPAVILIRKVIAHRDSNRMKAFEYYEYEKYEKSEYDLNNFTDEWLERRALKSFEVIKNYIDTSDLNGKPFVPMLIKERVSTVYYRRDPETSREVVSGNRISGFEESTFSQGMDQFLEKLNAQVDIYEPRIDLLDKSFTSPISNLGPNVYRYYVTDSTVIDSVKYTELSFLPRDRSFVAFTGKMWVADASLNYGVRDIELTLDSRININFLEDLRLRQSFEFSDTAGWVITKDEMTIDVQPTEKGLGIFNTKTTMYRNFKTGFERPEEFYAGLNKTVYDDEAEDRTDMFWDTARHEELNEREQGIFELADTISQIPEFLTLTRILEFAFTGYVKVNTIDVGPVSSFLSYNDVEGIRMRFGFRTNIDFHKKWRFTAWAAYGITDEKYKYHGAVDYYFKKAPRRRLHAGYTFDIYQPGFEVNWTDKDNIFLSFRRTPATNMFYREKFETFYEHEWLIGLSSRAGVRTENITDTRLNDLELNGSGNSLSSIQNNVLSFQTRLAINEKYIQGRFRRSPIRTTAPIFRVGYEYAGSITGSTYDYHKIQLSIQKRFKLGILGFSDIELEGAKMFGKASYPLLIIHRGNETIAYDERSYNMMNFLEFVSDETAAIMVTHHFNGLLSSFVPLVERTKLRAVVSGKLLYGNLSPDNSNPDDPELLQFPDRMYSLNNGPYVEASVGIENLFRFIRIDMVKRFTYLDHPGLSETFGVKGLAPRIMLQLTF